MYRKVIYGFLGGLVGLIAGVIVAGTVFPANTSGNPTPLALASLVIITLLGIGIGVSFAHFLNSRDSNSNRIVNNGPVQGTTSIITNLLITFVLVVIPNGVLQNRFGGNVAIAYSIALVIGFGLWELYKRRS